MSQAPTPNRVLSSMLDRLFSAIMTGPAMNCRPHNSRQRIDLVSLSNLRDVQPASVLMSLLSEKAAASVVATITAPASAREEARRRFGGGRKPTEAAASSEAGPEAAEDAAKRKAWTDQQTVLSKLRIIADEAVTYEQDTGVDVLHLGFPLISIPPGVPGPDGAPSTRRVLAPICFLPISVALRSGSRAAVDLTCSYDDIDRVQPNEALLAWVEQATGTRPELTFNDEDGSAPWKEICSLVNSVCTTLKLTPDPLFASDAALPDTLPLVATPRNDSLGDSPALICSAVLGLFPVSNQGLLRDTREMALEPSLQGAVSAFVRRESSGISPPPIPAAAPGTPPPTPPLAPSPTPPPRLVSPSDPCQSQSVELARSCPVLVIHGPPGTGKSQTITNIIGDHLARGERVLFVCDKRTAVDVVANRLEALGLGSLCAVVHDPQKDQKSLYMAVRTQLDELVDAKTRAAATKDLAAADAELDTLYRELTSFHRGLMSLPPGGSESLSNLVGQWLALRTPTSPPSTTRGMEPVPEADLSSISPEQFERSRVMLTELFDRAQEIAYSTCPWREACHGNLHTLLASPAQALRTLLESLATAAARADAALPKTPCASPAGVSMGVVASKRSALASQAAAVRESVPQLVRQFWAAKPAAAWAGALGELKTFSKAAAAIATATLDPTLVATIAASNATLPSLSQSIAALEAYLPTASSWFGFLSFGKKSAAAAALAPLGLALSAPSATAALSHLKAFRDGLLVHAACSKHAAAANAPLTDPAAAAAAHAQHLAVLECLCGCAQSTETATCLPVLLAELSESTSPSLKHIADHAALLAGVELAAKTTPFINPAWLQKTLELATTQATAGPAFAALSEHSESLDECLRIKSTLAALPAPLAAAAMPLAQADVTTPQAMQRLLRAVLFGEINRRLDAAPELKSLDSRRIDTLFARVRELEQSKQQHCRDAIMHLWTTRCKDRLLAGTQSRLNSDGASVKQRLFVKGAKAMRLRQVIAMGTRTPGGDPLFELRPIWMASPETVAQIFPREAVFDAVIFDEASQVRLEEALPVLARGKRIIIAGDPKQLPPSRFFESAAATESQTQGPESDAELFEQVQAETEDLLSAALSLDVHQSYLDVHYRSQNADLIEFSNHNFYASRLQAIPGHPKQRSSHAPLKLVNVPGIYEDRTNEPEAQAVVNLVRELLAQAKPPSIGIGCFNIAQRDLILELLDEAAADDAEFAAQLGKARARRSTSSFEGLFVKNLENVQGDERDHIIISTTYGPDPSGKFYRRFGPLAQPCGGRRLNVLVTRARQQVHILTSIPRAAYSSLPPVPEGSQPGGAWLLFAYLKFAEDLAGTYAAADRGDAPRRSEELVQTRTTNAPSTFAKAVAEYLAAEHKASSTVYWGNDGFCVDIATPSPDGGDVAPLGVMTDFARFNLAGDAVKWDIFRTGILTQLGWNLRRVWTPMVLRDPERVLTGLIQRTDTPRG